MHAHVGAPAAARTSGAPVTFSVVVPEAFLSPACMRRPFCAAGARMAVAPTEPRDPRWLPSLNIGAAGGARSVVVCARLPSATSPCITHATPTTQHFACNCIHSWQAALASQQLGHPPLIRTLRLAATARARRVPFFCRCHSEPSVHVPLPHGDLLTTSFQAARHTLNGARENQLAVFSCCPQQPHNSRLSCKRHNSASDVVLCCCADSPRHPLRMQETGYRVQPRCMPGPGKGGTQAARSAHRGRTQHGARAPAEGPAHKELLCN